MVCRWALASICILTLGCLPPPRLDVEPRAETEYHIAPPDQLAITIRPDPAVEEEVTVRPDGMISVHLIGEVMVRDKTVSEVQREIARRLKEFIVQPDVTVMLRSSNSRLYYVFGEVRRPGAYPLIGDVTALQGLFTAGGPTIFAVLRGAQMVRPTEGQGQVYAVNFKEITERGLADTNYLLEPNDVIYVPANGFAKVGYALRIVFFPLQQILGLGNTVVFQGGLGY